jgi:hypothetical protein
MNAIGCEVETRNYTALVVAPQLYARIGAPALQRYCPFCDSIIYSRRHKLCGVCAQELPEQMLFSAEQADNVSSMLRDEQQRHRAWLQRYHFAN